MSSHCVTCEKEDEKVRNFKKYNRYKKDPYLYRKWLKCNIKWREKNKKYWKNYIKKYELLNADKIRLRKQEYYLQNKEKILERNRLWKIKNKKKKQIYINYNHPWRKYSNTAIQMKIQKNDIKSKYLYDDIICQPFDKDFIATPVPIFNTKERPNYVKKTQKSKSFNSSYHKQTCLL